MCIVWELDWWLVGMVKVYDVGFEWSGMGVENREWKWVFINWDANLMGD